jgi:hypothetical protein
VNIYAWCAKRADAFRDMERHEMAMYPSNDDRDQALVEWTIRVLANRSVAGTAEVLAEIEERRARDGRTADAFESPDEIAAYDRARDV